MKMLLSSIPARKPTLVPRSYCSSHEEDSQQLVHRLAMGSAWSWVGNLLYLSSLLRIHLRAGVGIRPWVSTRTTGLRCTLEGYDSVSKRVSASQNTSALIELAHDTDTSVDSCFLLVCQYMSVSRWLPESPGMMLLLYKGGDQRAQQPRLFIWNSPFI